MLVVVIDPDRDRRQRLAADLRYQWRTTQVVTASTAKLGLRLLRAHRPDAVVLATGQASPAALDVLRDLRRLSDTPVLLVARNGSEAEEIRSLRLGADDYIAEPVSGALLAARIDAVRRRGGLAASTSDVPDFQTGALSVWFSWKLVSVRGMPVKLTPLEYELLYYLARSAGEVVPTQILIDRVWGDQYEATTKYLKVFIHRLRSKLGRGPDLPSIQTERRVGYRLKPAESSGAPSAT
ncbi:MAG TPA: response regulator transcription factor [Chloroflexota bacterium]